MRWLDILTDAIFGLLCFPAAAWMVLVYLELRKIEKRLSWLVKRRIEDEWSR